MRSVEFRDASDLSVSTVIEQSSDALAEDGCEVVAEEGEASAEDVEAEGKEGTLDCDKE